MVSYFCTIFTVAYGALSMNWSFNPLGWVPRVSFISRFYCIASTRLGPKSVLYIQVLLYSIH